MDLKTLSTRFSTLVVTALMGTVYWWLNLPLAEQAALIKEYQIFKHAAPLTGWLAFLFARAWPQPPKEDKE